MFAELLKHFLQCSNDARDLIRHDIWRQMFVQLFFDCDYGKVARQISFQIIMVIVTCYLFGMIGGAEGITLQQPLFSSPQFFSKVTLILDEDKIYSD